jgi:hypothetical protein
MRASNQASWDDHVSVRLAKQTRAMIMTGMMTAILMTRVDTASHFRFEEAILYGLQEAIETPNID